MNLKLLPILFLPGLLSVGCAQAQTAAPALSQSSRATPVTGANFDSAAFAQWMDGREQPIEAKAPANAPQWVIWTNKTNSGYSGLKFGDTKTPGARHLRVGFKQPIAVGSVLVRGGGSLSFLKDWAAYPGDMSNENNWTPASRLVNGKPSRAEVGKDEYAQWVLPAGTQTRALRFSHQASATDTEFAGFLGGAFVSSEREVNLAPLALAQTSAGAREASKLTNGDDDKWNAWANRESNAKDARAQVSAGAPEWLMLSWPEPVELSGLQLLWAGFGGAQVQSYDGDGAPIEAKEGDWNPVGAFDKIVKGYPNLLWPNRLDFGKTVKTRAIRVRITAPADESGPHMGGKTHDGKRVWLGELMALSPLKNETLQAVSFETADKVHPPIPVKFTLDKPGRVTLVIEKADGTRVRNLVANTPFPAGENIAWWDGTDDLGRDMDAAGHGVYHIPAQLVAPGNYRVRGLVHDEIVPRYEFSIYSPGTPPWETADKTGGWTTNHTPPQAALFLPADKAPGGKPLVYLGSYVSEGGAGLAWVDQNGVKQGGRGWIGGNWTAAPYLSADKGANAAPDAYAYVASVWETAKRSGKFELRVTALTKGGDKEVARTQFDPFNDREKKEEINGLAVHNGLIAVSLPRQKKIQFARVGADLKGQLLAAAPVDDARGLLFQSDGKLLALVGTQLRRYTVSDGGTLSAPQTLAQGLQDPQGLAQDAAGNIYVSDWGTTHQVKVFDATGKAIRTIGKAGAPTTGPYDPLHLNHPHGMAIDGNGRLWVTEHDYLPKRVSIWNADGSLWKAFYGPAKYGGGGTLDPNDPTRFLYADEEKGTLEFRLDWKSGEAKLNSVLVRGSDMELPFRAAAPELPLVHNGQRYLTNSYNTNPTDGHTSAMLYIEKNGVAQPAAAMGKATHWKLLEEAPFKANWPAGAKDALFAWSDTNGDGRAQPAEVSYRAADRVDGVTVMPDLSFAIARVDEAAMRFAPSGFTDAGVPRYDAGKGETIVDGVQNPGSSGGDQLLTQGKDKWSVVTLGVEPFARQSLSGVKNGEPKWSYPSLWPGLHASHEAPEPSMPGQLIGTTRLMGNFFDSDAGPLWAINSNSGTPYIFTADGLFVTTLLSDFRQGQRWTMPAEQRGIDVSGITLSDENFWPTITQTPDGKVYMTSGRNSGLLRLDGMDTVKRLPDSQINVGTDDLKAAQTYIVRREAARQQMQGSGLLKVAVGGKAPTVDGKLDDWNGSEWADIDKSGVKAYFNSKSKPYDVTGTIKVSGDRLFAAYNTGNAELLKNSGEVPTAPFKTGGALDLMIGTNAGADPKRTAPVAGDLRLLVTMVKNKPKAVLYRAVVPGTKDPIPFSSPWRTITFDEVEDVSDQIQLAGAEGNYEFSIPLATLGLKPQSGQSLSGDIGILRGNDGQTTARVYWSNKATGIVADVPSEAMLTPNLWGKFELVAG